MRHLHTRWQRIAPQENRRLLVSGVAILADADERRLARRTFLQFSREIRCVFRNFRNGAIVVVQVERGGSREGDCC